MSRSPDATDVAANLSSVRGRVEAACSRAGRALSSVTIVAATKTRSAVEISAAINAGVGHVGENRVQEAEARKDDVVGAATWHLIGPLQSNKARRALTIFDRIDSVDSLQLATRLDRIAGEVGRERVPILAQVRLGGEATKSGLDESEAVAEAARMDRLSRLRLDGLMAIPPPGEAADSLRWAQRLGQLRRELEDALGRSLPTLSIGMSHDFESAIEGGATEVRLGTVLFGRRP